MRDARPAAVIILAAGEGTRMRSAVPKVLHEIAGRSLLGHLLAACAPLSADHTLVVVGHGRNQVVPALERLAPQATVVNQATQRGTGHAVRLALDAVPLATGPVLVVPGDTPLLGAETLGRLVDQHLSSGAAATLLTAVLPDPSGYGRVVRDARGAVERIVEHRDADPEQLRIDEVGTSVYAFDAALLRDALARVRTDNAQGEEYLTDVIGLLVDDGRPVGALAAHDPAETVGVNDRVQLAAAGQAMNRRLLERAMLAGTTVVDPASTWIGVEVELEPDTLLLPGTQLLGRTRVGRDAVIGPECTLVDTVAGAGARVVRAHCERAEIGAGATVGPYAYLRPGARLGPGAKVGTYVEIKNAELGEGAKVPHLTYVGDATIGEGTNIGASSVFVNYDGVRKHRTTIGSHARTGSDTMFVAPVTVGDGAYTGAGTVVRRDVPPGALAVSGGEQRILPGWVERSRPGSPSAEAARRARENSETMPEDEHGDAAGGDRQHGGHGGHRRHGRQEGTDGSMEQRR